MNVLFVSMTEVTEASVGLSEEAATHVSSSLTGYRLVEMPNFEKIHSKDLQELR
jgi:hypothetical protein